MPATNAWDETKPAGSDLASTIDNQTRQLKLDIRERLALQHYWNTGVAEDGIHKEVSITPATTNTALLKTNSNQSITGASAVSIVDLGATWNTTGAPTALKINITNTASDAASLLIDLQVGGVSQFKVSKAGVITGTGTGITSIPETAITDGSLLARLAATETITAKWTIAASTGLVIASGAPGVTTNTLYSDTGALYFNGSVLATGSSVSGTSGKICKFTGTSTVGDSIMSESGTTITVASTLNATTLGGTLSTASQPNITGLGTVSFSGVVTLTTTGQILVATTATTQAAYVEIGNSATHLLLGVDSNAAGTFGSGANAAVLYSNSSSGLSIMAADAGGDIRFYAGGGTLRGQIGDNGNWTIGAQSPVSTYKLYARGTTAAAGNYGLVVDNSSGSISLAVENNGNVLVGGGLTVTGALSKGSGTFLIKHPFKPQTKLYHGFIEGPRYDLIYRGYAQVVNGFARVSIDSASRMTPGTFAALTQNPQAWVTGIGGVSVLGHVDGGDLVITAPAALDGMVSWIVIAERADEHIRSVNNVDQDGRLIPEWSDQ